MEQVVSHQHGVTGFRRWRPTPHRTAPDQVQTLGIQLSSTPRASPEVTAVRAAFHSIGNVLAMNSAVEMDPAIAATLFIHRFRQHVAISSGGWENQRSVPQRSWCAAVRYACPR